MLQGDWGFSFASRINVDTLILQRLPATLFVIGSSQILALLIALPVGVYAATRPYSIFDQIANTLAFIGFSLPTFFTGLLFILLFSIHLDWLPFVYRADIGATGWRWYWEQFRQAIMPVAVLGLFQGGVLDALCALRGARRDPARLCHHGARQGAHRARGHHQACRAQCADPGRDAGRAADAGAVRRRHRHRADLPHARHRLAADQRDPRQRHAGHHGGDLRVRLPGDPVQPDRRHPLWLARPSHRLPLARADARREPGEARLAGAQDIWRRFRRHRLALVGAVILPVMLLGGGLRAAGCGTCRSTTSISPRSSRRPSWRHPFGTDDLGQDLLARMLYGGRISLAVGLAAMLMAVVVGTVVGAIAGMSRGSVDTALMWLTDLFLSLPQLPLLLLIIYLFRDSLKKLVGPELGVFILIVAVIGGFRWMPVARLVRAQFLSLREKEFVEAARALGATRLRQVVRHILPNALGPVIVAGDDRRRRRDHRRVDACRSSASAFRPTSRPGDASCSTPRTISTSRRTGRCSPAARSSSRCCRSTSSATACATRSTRASVIL